jgi:hypothetical protein
MPGRLAQTSGPPNPGGRRVPGLSSDETAWWQPQQTHSHRLNTGGPTFRPAVGGPRGSRRTKTHGDKHPTSLVLPPEPCEPWSRGQRFQGRNKGRPGQMGQAFAPSHVSGPLGQQFCSLFLPCNAAVALVTAVSDGRGKTGSSLALDITVMSPLSRHHPVTFMNHAKALHHKHTRPSAFPKK